MFELPEYVILARQINESVAGKAIRSGSLGNSPHKFVWYNRTHDEFAGLAQGKTVGQAAVRGRWLFVPLQPGHVLLFGECGGRLLYLTQMWGAMELYEAGQELERQYVKDMRATPVEPEFTFAYFTALIDSLLAGPKRSVKALLTQEQLIPGLGNAIARWAASQTPHHEHGRSTATQAL